MQYLDVAIAEAVYADVPRIGYVFTVSKQYIKQSDDFFLF
jgi:hypothetical protein